MKLSYFIIGWALFVIAFVSVAGFRGQHFNHPPMEIFPDMNYQSKVKDQAPSGFFADNQASRPPVEGTIAQEMPAKADYWSTGKWDETHWGNGIPVHLAQGDLPALQIDALNLNRGRERYGIYCSACHGAVGDGKGITSKYGMSGAANYHSDHYRAISDGDIYNTINKGKGQMFGLGANISIDDRWRIVMYVRALQLSQYAPFADASTDEQTTLLASATKKPATLLAPAPAPSPNPAPAPKTP